jgi:hypothetical protein
MRITAIHLGGVLVSLFCALALCCGMTVSGAAGSALDPRGFCEPGRSPSSFGVDPGSGRRALDPRLVIQRRPVRAGESLNVRLVNGGSDELRFGIGDRYQRWVSVYELHQVFSNGLTINTGRMVGIRFTQVTSVHHGDSGAPVYNCHTHRAVGLMSGAQFANREAFVVPLAPLLEYGGVSQPGILNALQQPGSGHQLYLYPFG